MNDSVRMVAGVAPGESPVGVAVGAPMGTLAELATDIPVFGLGTLAMVFCGSELAVYGATTLLLPLLDLKAGAFLLAWGVSLVLMGPLLGLMALYAVLRLRLKGQPVEAADPAIMPRAQTPLAIRPRTDMPKATPPRPRSAEGAPPPPVVLADTGRPARHPG
ncbi:hypothetical protein [Azospirillum sp. B4]|uniref:hypothetical protein n=1 Tax=Azospirillum sp. B4 TaxID=95605 RepID=UPI000346607B|nr:hypothetical protein [Azospirillum sp. B4]